LNTVTNSSLPIVKKIDFGVDAPGTVRTFFISGAVASALAIGAFFVFGNSGWALLLELALFLAGAYLFCMGCLMLYWSGIEKVRRSENVLKFVAWRGDEQVLDVGCGRGLMTIGAAQHLTTGRVIGVDIWTAKDQVGSIDMAIHNAQLTQVQQKVEFQTADARQLPFADESFDVVVSHWVIHNIETQADRTKAFSEINRVLRPGGVILIGDTQFRDEYVKTCKALGFTDGRVIFNRSEDSFLNAISFGSFRPMTLFAHKPTRANT
jgi:arsenite methyltransferase